MNVNAAAWSASECASAFCSAAQDGYVSSKEVEIACRRSGHLGTFTDVCREIVARGVDVVDEDFENIYRRNHGWDCEDESDEMRKVITKDLEEKYSKKVLQGHKGLLASVGLPQGAFVANRTSR